MSKTSRAHKILSGRSGTFEVRRQIAFQDRLAKKIKPMNKIHAGNRRAKHGARIEKLFHPVERQWYAEVFDRHSKLAFTSRLHPTAAEAIAEARAWLDKPEGR